MKRVVFASVSLLAIAAASAASAADLPRRTEMVTKAPSYIAQVYNWTGPYLGINAGAGWSRSSFGAPFAGDSRSSGALVGLTLGSNWQAGQLVYGIEGDIDWTNFRGSATCGGVTCDVRNSWLGTVRGRLGFAADRFMPYVTGGLAVGDIRTNVAGFGSGSSTKAGWTLGGGVEFALAAPWTAKVEYLYADLGRGGGVAGTDTSFRANILRAGLNYRF
jgi:outer membrane immunogenic protein